MRGRAIVSKLEHLVLRLPGAYLRWSARKVPHIVVSSTPYDLSVCYFASTNQWRVFWPYPSWGRTQNKQTFYSVEAAVEFVVKGWDRMWSCQ